MNKPSCSICVSSTNMGISKLDVFDDKKILNWTWAGFGVSLLVYGCGSPWQKNTNQQRFLLWYFDVLQGLPLCCSSSAPVGHMRSETFSSAKQTHEITNNTRWWYTTDWHTRWWIAIIIGTRKTHRTYTYNIYNVIYIYIYLFMFFWLLPQMEVLQTRWSAMKTKTLKWMIWRFSDSHSLSFDSSTARALLEWHGKKWPVHFSFPTGKL